MEWVGWDGVGPDIGDFFSSEGQQQLAETLARMPDAVWERALEVRRGVG